MHATPAALNAGIPLSEDSAERHTLGMEEWWKRRERRGKSAVVVDEKGGGPGSAARSPGPPL